MLGAAAAAALAACTREGSGGPSDGGAPTTEGFSDGGDGSVTGPFETIIQKAGYDGMTVTLVEDGALRSWDVTLLSGAAEILRFRIQGAWDGEAPSVDGYQRLEEVRALAGAPTLPDEVVMPRSNWEFAFQIDVDGDKQFVPYHGSPTAFAEQPAIISLDGVPVDLGGMALGHAVTARSFSLQQTVLARHPARDGEDLARITTTTTLEADGRLRVEGTLDALQDFVVGSAYGPMLPFSREVFDQVETDSVGSLEVDSVAEAQEDGEPVEQTIPIDGSTSALIRSTDSGWSAAIRWIDADETLRAEESEEGISQVFLQLRDDGIAKIYPQVWGQGESVPGGTTWDFGAEWIIAPVL